ncbi:MAG: hypothetical protein LBJ67_11535 [Planctomycetaceae bacterium]|nr:hypothetical protein [Planctomycetaceae bacterium]
MSAQEILYHMLGTRGYRSIKNPVVVGGMEFSIEANDSEIRCSRSSLNPQQASWTLLASKLYPMKIELSQSYQPQVHLVHKPSSTTRRIRKMPQTVT